ncbi:hypothetical protein BC567DRAFT_282348 [Phyllosticta citribraziliensis]
MTALYPPLWRLTNAPKAFTPPHEAQLVVKMEVVPARLPLILALARPTQSSTKTPWARSKLHHRRHTNMNSPSALTRDALEASQRARAHARGQPEPLTNALFQNGLSPPFDQDNYFVGHPLFDAIDRLKDGALSNKTTQATCCTNLPLYHPRMPQAPQFLEMWAQAKAFHFRNMAPHVFALRVPQDIETEIANLYVEISALEQKAMAGELGLWQP